MNVVMVLFGVAVCEEGESIDFVLGTRDFYYFGPGSQFCFEWHDFQQNGINLADRIRKKGYEDGSGVQDLITCVNCRLDEFII